MKPSTIMGWVPATIYFGLCLLAATIFSQHQLFAQSPERSGVLKLEIKPQTINQLDGLQFKTGITKREDGSDNSLEDTIIFENGKFSSVVCKRYNFSAAPYWTRTEGDTIHFLAELDSPTDGKMLWKGRISKGKLEGTMRWSRKRWYWNIDAEHKIQGKLNVDTKKP